MQMLAFIDAGGKISKKAIGTDSEIIISGLDSSVIESITEKSNYMAKCAVLMLLREPYKRQPPQMAHYHMRRSIISIGRPGDKNRKIDEKKNRNFCYNYSVSVINHIF